MLPFIVYVILISEVDKNGLCQTLTVIDDNMGTMLLMITTMTTTMMMTTMVLAVNSFQRNDHVDYHHLTSKQSIHDILYTSKMLINNLIMNIYSYMSKHQWIMNSNVCTCSNCNKKGTLFYYQESKRNDKRFLNLYSNYNVDF